MAGFGSIFQLIGDTGAGNYGTEGRAALGQQYDAAKNFLSPYNTAGTDALSGYQSLLKDPSSITSNPGYQFRFKQGQDAITNNALAKGEFGSGNTGRALTEYGQNFADTELDKSLARFSPLLSMGYGAAGQDANLAMGYGNALSNSMNTRDLYSMLDSMRKLNAASDFGDSVMSMGMGSAAGGGMGG